ncbi:ABC transporter substrate-binding protein [Leucobacter sp. gxy201]|uniref:ABC transporter substrate-binding protein n=1 Tax=Leucobacter sp. gxy201 TaxID=2957200 RepID=UPI003DA184DF
MFRAHRPGRLIAAAALATASLLVLTGCNPPSKQANDGPLPTDEAELVEAAQQEGKVSLGAGGHTNAQAELLAEKFEEKYDIPVEFIRENSGQISQKVEAQKDAGNVAFDVISLNDSSTLGTWSADDVLADPAVPNLDDVLAPLQVDDEHYVAFTWAAAGFVYNEAKIDASTIPKTWMELAESDSRKVIADPGTSGAALNFLGALNETAADVLPVLGAGDVLRSESALALGQMVSTGEADYGLPGIEHDVATARTAGEPLAMGYPEGKLGVLPSYIAPLSSAAHPAAARLLVQFSLSEEFQQAQRELGSRSVLGAVPVPEGLEELGEDRMLMIDQTELAAERDELLAEFDRDVK